MSACGRLLDVPGLLHRDDLDVPLGPTPISRPRDDAHKRAAQDSASNMTFGCQSELDSHLIRHQTMNFYAAPPTVTAKLYVRVPEELRCRDRASEWRGGFSRPFQNIFLEGPLCSSSGDLYVVDIPYGRILRISPTKEVTVETEWDGEPNGLAMDSAGKIAIADYKQVCLGCHT
jgi:hypothetical protein